MYNIRVGVWVNNRRSVWRIVLVVISTDLHRRVSSMVLVITLREVRIMKRTMAQVTVFGSCSHSSVLRHRSMSHVWWQYIASSWVQAMISIKDCSMMVQQAYIRLIAVDRTGSASNQTWASLVHGLSHVALLTEGNDFLVILRWRLLFIRIKFTFPCSPIFSNVRDILFFVFIFAINVSNINRNCLHWMKMRLILPLTVVLCFWYLGGRWLARFDNDGSYISCSRTILSATLSLLLLNLESLRFSDLLPIIMLETSAFFMEDVTLLLLKGKPGSLEVLRQLLSFNRVLIFWWTIIFIDSLLFVFDVGVI